MTILRWFMAATLLLPFGVASAATSNSVNVPITITVPSGLGNEIFVGPFANWLNVKTTAGCGAVGNGSTDDTAAIQNCINKLSSTTPVLWLPAGTYKVTAALQVVNKQFVSIIGADPATTKILWGGAANSQVMLQMLGDVYSRVDRITFDGNNSVGVLVQDNRENAAYFFDTGNEYADDVFINAGGSYNSSTPVDFACGYAIGASALAYGDGCAEAAILRDNFSGGGLGVSTGNANAADVWTWYSTFSGKSYALYGSNGASEVSHAFHSNFLNSGNFDIYSHYFAGGTITYSWNYSRGAANGIVDTDASFPSPAPILFEHNTIVNTGSSQSIAGGWQGQYFLMDNTIISKAGATAPAVAMTNSAGDILSTGNNYTIGTANTCGNGGALQSSGRCHAVADTVGSFGDPGAPILPGTPPNTGPGGSNTVTIYEVRAGSSTTAIQTAINNAAAAGNGAVVHLQAGNYTVTSPLSVPGNIFIQIIGDGYNTTLNGSVGAGNPVITCGPACKAWFRDLTIAGNGASAGMQITGADHSGASGGRVFMEQPYLHDNSSVNLYVNGLNYTNVEGHDVVATASSGDDIRVVGGSGANTASTSIFAGQSSLDLNLFRISNNGHLVVRQWWNDANGSEHSGATMSQASSTGGSLTIAGMAANFNGTPGNYFNFSNFSGTSALIDVNANEGVSPANEVINGTGTGANNLSFGFIGCATTLFSDTTSPADTYALMGPRYVASCGHGGTATQLSEASRNVSNLGSFLSTTLGPLRAALPTVPGASGDPALASGVTDTRFYRVQSTQSVYGIDVEP